jgi:hypothetical protein
MLLIMLTLLLILLTVGLAVHSNQQVAGDDTNKEMLCIQKRTISMFQWHSALFSVDLTLACVHGSSCAGIFHRYVVAYSTPLMVSHWVYTVLLKGNDSLSTTRIGTAGKCADNPAGRPGSRPMAHGAFVHGMYKSCQLSAANRKALHGRACVHLDASQTATCSTCRPSDDFLHEIDCGILPGQ